MSVRPRFCGLPAAAGKREQRPLAQSGAAVSVQPWPKSPSWLPPRTTGGTSLSRLIIRVVALSGGTCFIITYSLRKFHFIPTNITRKNKSYEACGIPLCDTKLET